MLFKPEEGDHIFLRNVSNIYHFGRAENPETHQREYGQAWSLKPQEVFDEKKNNGFRKPCAVGLISLYGVDAFKVAAVKSAVF